MALLLLQIAPWIRDLGDEDYAVRERATAALVEAGESAVPALKEAAESGDPEIRVRADALLDTMLKVEGRISVDPLTHRIRVELINRKLRSVVVAAVPDCHRREVWPRVTLEVCGPDGAAIRRSECPLVRIHRFDNVIPLVSDSQLIRLAPGGSTSPFATDLESFCINCLGGRDAIVLETPGAYQARFVFDASVPEGVDVSSRFKCDVSIPPDLLKSRIDTGWIELTVEP